MSTEDARLDLSLDVDGALVLSGEIDSYTAPRPGHPPGRRPTGRRVDLAGVTFIDSSGLRTLIEAHQVARRRRPGARHAGASAPVQRLLEISGLAGHLDVTT